MSVIVRTCAPFFLLIFLTDRNCIHPYQSTGLGGIGRILCVGWFSDTCQANQGCFEIGRDHQRSLRFFTENHFCGTIPLPRIGNAFVGWVVRQGNMLNTPDYLPTKRVRLELNKSYLAPASDFRQLKRVGFRRRALPLKIAEWGQKTAGCRR
jgi:hypothetical protein